MEAPLFKIITENQYFAVVSKEAGLQVEPDKMGHPNLLDAFKNYLSKRGAVRWGPGLPHRLDRPTSGLVVLSKRKNAHQSLQTQWENREVDKYYLAKVQGNILMEKGVLSHFLFKDTINFRAQISDTALEGYKNCSLEYTVIKRYDKFTLLKIKLLTGRYHQIRAQMAHIGHPIVGDVFYGSNVHLGEVKILLHAYQLRFKAPPSNDWITVEHMPEWESD